MYKTIILVLLVAMTSAIRMETTAKSHQRIEELKKTELGSTILELVSLHSISQGPVDELITAVNDLVEDLSSELEVLENEFKTRTNVHNS